jgi:hypothetical protein
MVFSFLYLALRALPLQPDRLDGEEVDREHALYLRPQESTPGSPEREAAGLSPAWRRIFLSRRRHGQTEAVQLAGDPR